MASMTVAGTPSPRLSSSTCKRLLKCAGRKATSKGKGKSSEPEFRRVLQSLGLDHRSLGLVLDGNGATVAHRAASAGDVELLSYLFDHAGGVLAVDVRDRIGKTPLHEASAAGRRRAVCWLLDRGALASSTKTNAWTPLMYAARSGHVDVVRVLLEREEVDPNATWRANHEEGATAIFLASRFGQLQCVEELLAHGADPRQACTNGRAPVHVAARNGHALVLASLLRAGADASEVTKDCRGQTALHEMAEEGRAAMIKGLLEMKSDGDSDGHGHGNGSDSDFLINRRRRRRRRRRSRLVSARNASGRVPLHLAAREGHADAVAALLDWRRDEGWEGQVQGEGEGEGEEETQGISTQHADVRDSRYCTPLFLACARGHVEAVRALLERGADPCAACECECEDEREGEREGEGEGEGGGDAQRELNFKPSKQTQPARACLHVAAGFGHGECVAALLRAGADPEARDKDGRTAAEVAARTGFRFDCLEQAAEVEKEKEGEGEGGEGRTKGEAETSREKEKEKE